MALPPGLGGAIALTLNGLESVVAGLINCLALRNLWVIFEFEDKVEELQKSEDEKTWLVLTFLFE